MQRASIPLWVVLVGVLTAGALAGDVEFAISARNTYVGVPVQLQVTITNADDHEQPVLPDIDGADVRLSVPSTRSMTSIINGRVEQTSTITYTVSITPRHTGTLVIPSVRVKVDGAWSSSPPTQIQVEKSDTGNLLFVDVVSDRDSVYVGEPFDATLEIWIKPFRSREVKLNEQTMWRSCVDTRNSHWGAFADVVNAGQVRVHTEWREDENGEQQKYFVYMLKHEVWPQRAGKFDASDVSIVVQYPMAVRRNGFSVFSPEYSISSARPLSATVEDVAITIKSPPSEGRPSIYRGAVGQYQMRVSAAPTEVSVGDPISITIDITSNGSGRLDSLQPPPLVDQKALTTDFRVPDEELAGVVENGVKRFTQSIRAMHDQVTEIPPIAFAYFDPRREQYVTLKSDPIPISVKESTRMAVSQVVDSARHPAGTDTELTLLEGGVWTNYDDVSELLASQSMIPTRRVWGVALILPLIYVTCLLVSRRYRRLSNDHGFARRRVARRTALAHIANLNGADATAAATTVTSAVTGYVADRCNLPPGGLTRVDAVSRLRQGRISEDLVCRVDGLLTECENAQYAGGGRMAAADMITRARQYLNELERSKL